MSENVTDSSGTGKVLVTALIVGGIITVASILACGVVAVIFIYNAPW